MWRVQCGVGYNVAPTQIGVGYKVASVTMWRPPSKWRLPMWRFLLRKRHMGVQAAQRERRKPDSQLIFSLPEPENGTKDRQNPGGGKIQQRKTRNVPTGYG